MAENYKNVKATRYYALSEDDEDLVDDFIESERRKMFGL